MKFETLEPAKTEKLEASRLALGTANLLEGYGVGRSSLSGNPDKVREIFSTAIRRGVSLFDTAPAYGNAETILGTLDIGKNKIVTKLPEIRAPRSSPSQICDTFHSSLENLGLKEIYGLLLHKPEQLDSDLRPNILRALHMIMADKHVKKIGLSVYESESLSRWLEMFPFQIIQLPCNVFDRRFEFSGWLSRLRAREVEIHARSVFLQGSLLRPPGQLPQNLARFSPHWSSWHKWLQEQNLSPLSGCLAHVAGLKEISHLVVGVDSADQLEAILDCQWPKDLTVPKILAADNLSLIDPRCWLIG